MTDQWGFNERGPGGGGNATPQESVGFYEQLRDGTSREIIYDHASYPFARIPVNNGTVFPQNPFIGQVFVYTADRVNGVYWQFIYLPDESAYPWKYLGGPEMRSFVGTQESGGATINTWMDLATTGPSIFAPFAGDYDLRLHSTLTSPATISTSNIGVAIGAGTPAIAFPQTVPAAVASNFDVSPPTTYVDIAAGAELRMRYFQNAADWSWAARYLYAVPVRVRA